MRSSSAAGVALASLARADLSRKTRSQPRSTWTSRPKSSRASMVEAEMPRCCMRARACLESRSIGTSSWVPIVAGLLAQGMSLTTAAVASTYLVGLQPDRLDQLGVLVDFCGEEAAEVVWTASDGIGGVG